MRGLRWSDIDLKACELHVRQRADEYNVIGAPKSDASVRTIPIDPDVMAPALKEWKLKCPPSDFVLQHGQTAGLQRHSRRQHRSGDEGRETHRQGWRAEIYTTCPPSFLCVVVHQSEGARGPRAATQAGAIPARAFHHIHDVRHLRPLVPQRRQPRRVDRSGATVVGVNAPRQRNHLQRSHRQTRCAARLLRQVRLRNAAMSQSANQPPVVQASAGLNATTRERPSLLTYIKARYGGWVSQWCSEEREKQP